jgi:chromosome partitioning protein
MRTWAFCSQKGGVGKTSLSVHLAAYAVACGEVPVIIDLDPQESARQWHRLRGDESTPPMVISALADNLGKLKQAAETLGQTLMIIDTAPATDAGALAAIRIADLIIAPMLPNFFDIDALKSTVRLIERAGKLDSAVCVVNGVHYQSAEQDFREARDQAAAIGIAVSPVYCVHRRSYARALREGKGVTEYTPKDAKAAAEIHAVWMYLNGGKPVRAKPAKTRKAKGGTA